MRKPMVFCGEKLFSKNKTKPHIYTQKFALKSQQLYIYMYTHICINIEKLLGMG